MQISTLRTHQPIFNHRPKGCDEIEKGLSSDIVLLSQKYKGLVGRLV